MLRPIHHTFGPHADFRTMLASARLMVQPWKYRQGPEREQLRERLERGFNGSCSLFSTGREGLLTLLRALDFPQGSEVILQAFTCVALPNAIHAASYTPVYADIDPETLNLSLTSIRASITPRTKAIICQHTFGIVCAMDALKKICDEHGLLLIEDCAHILPDVTGPKSIGTNADILMLSFGRDKAISGVSGGAIICKDGVLGEKLKEAEKRSSELPYSVVWRLLLYVSAYFKANLVYGTGVSRIGLWLMRKVGLLLPVVTSEEKQGLQCPGIYRMPNACAALALRELKKIHTVNNHRRVLVKRYLKAANDFGWKYPAGIHEHLPLQKFPIFLQDADRTRSELKRKNIHLDDGWNGAPVCPRTVDQIAAGYRRGSCPLAEHVSEQVLSLPTHPTMSLSQAEVLIHHLSKRS